MDDPRVHWPATNLRELGGYPTPHGPVRRGVLFRGGRMDELDPAGVAVYRGLGLATIVDLRRDDEIAEAPTPRFGDERNVHLSVSMGRNAFAEAAAKAGALADADEVLSTAGEYYEMLVTERLPLFRQVFDTILDADGAPVLFHCTAGKDRTGFVAAALLKFLDVDDAVVFDDYTFTDTVRAAWIDERVEFHRRSVAEERGIDPDDVPEHALAAWRALMGAPERFLRTTFAAVEEHYGDWHELRRSGLGIDDDRLAAWRSAVVG